MNNGGNQTFDITSNKSSSQPFEELPAGLAMAFAQNTKALARFTNLSSQEQDEIIRRAKNVKSRDEMRHLVRSIYESDLME
ncbi:MAG: hypothetical protein ACOYIJ_08890 [Eubacteriales bacterium]|jgi:uncharacterized protein YdeI (YjbR/CyaY-like superfamily)